MKARPWTPEEDQRLRELAQEGFSCRGLAALVGRSYRGVRYRMGRLGLRSLRANAGGRGQVATIIELANRGHDNHQIAAVMRRTPAAIAASIWRQRQRGAPLALRPQRRWTEAENRRLIELNEEGLRYREIATELDRTPFAVRTRLRLQGHSSPNGRGRPPRLLARRPPVPAWTGGPRGPVDLTDTEEL